MINVHFTIPGIFVINTANTSLVTDAPENGEAGIVYYGPMIDNTDADKLAAAGYQARGLYSAYGLNGNLVAHCL